MPPPLGTQAQGSPKRGRRGGRGPNARCWEIKGSAWAEGGQEESGKVEPGGAGWRSCGMERAPDCQSADQLTCKGVIAGIAAGE